MRRLRNPSATGGFDEFLLLQRHHLAADNAGHRQPFHRADGQEQQEDAAPHKNHQQNDEHRERQRVEHIHDPHHHDIEFAAKITGHRAVEQTDGQRDRRGAQPDEQGNAPAHQHARQHIPTELVGAEPVPGARAGDTQIQILIFIRIGKSNGPDGGGQFAERRTEETNQGEADHEP